MNDRAKHREPELAEMVANGTSVSDAGRVMGLTKGQTSRVWNNIKRTMGRQAI